MWPTYLGIDTRGCEVLEVKYLLVAARLSPALKLVCWSVLPTLQHVRAPSGLSKRSIFAAGVSPPLLGSSNAFHHGTHREKAHS